MGDEPAVVPDRGVLRVPDEVWARAVRRAEVIGRLAQGAVVGHEAADAAAAELEVSRRQVYVLLARWRTGEGVVSDLLPRRSDGGRGREHLPVEVEAVLRDVVRTRYLTRQRRSVAAVHREIKRICLGRGLPVPSRGALVRRIAKLDPVAAVTARQGADAARALRSAGGSAPVVHRLLERVQIDHTVVDVMVVDERHRLPIGRPYVTGAIDVRSRCVVGLVVTLEAPSALSVGLCLAHMVTDKKTWLERIEVNAGWPMSGKPGELYLDNAAEFHSEALRRGCDQHGIKLNYRPPGRPHYGGIIERVIGTMMGMVHELPGTTFSNPTQRGGYDSDARAVLTVHELQRWLALAVAGYHGQVHATLGQTPAGCWADEVAACGRPATVINEAAFLVEFLPVIRRTLTRAGFVIDHVQYYSDALKP
jgi:putative transposase